MSARSYLALAPALQEVWTAVYAATVAGVESTDESGGQGFHTEKQGNYAEERAWEAVRRANGGEMPALPDSADRDEPATEDMIEALAPIVAMHDRKAWEAQPSPLVRAHWLEEARRYFRKESDNWTPEFRDVCELALAVWKAARGAA